MTLQRHYVSIKFLQGESARHEGEAVAELPRHPEARDDADRARPGESAGSRPWLAYIVGLTVAAVLVLMIVLHLTGAIGPGAH
jgi:hypothetical protein